MSFVVIWVQTLVKILGVTDTGKCSSSDGWVHPLQPTPSPLPLVFHHLSFIIASIVLKSRDNKVCPRLCVCRLPASQFYSSLVRQGLNDIEVYQPHHFPWDFSKVHLPRVVIDASLWPSPPLFRLPSGNNSLPLLVCKTWPPKGPCNSLPEMFGWSTFCYKICNGL